MNPVMDQEDRPIVTVEQVAELLAIHPRTVRTYMASGVIRSTKIGRLRRTTNRWLREYVERFQTTASK